MYCTRTVLCTVHWLYCVLYTDCTVHCTLTVLCTVQWLYCALYSDCTVHCTLTVLCSVHWLYCALYTDFTVHCTLTVLCTDCTVNCTLNVLCTVHWLYCALYTDCTVLCTALCTVLCTVRFTQLAYFRVHAAEANGKTGQGCVATYQPIVGRWQLWLCGSLPTEAFKRTNMLDCGQCPNVQMSKCPHWSKVFLLNSSLLPLCHCQCVLVWQCAF